jgi:diguanylate cyclase (GGDEF)-like protein
MLLVMLEDEVAESKWLALHDQLTELPNRRLLDDHLESALQRAERENGSVAIFVIDLNGFKAVNDTYGHPIGDFVLVESSRRMLGELRPEDMLARLGGDEFVIVVPCANDVEGLPKLQQRLEDTLAMPFNVGGQVVTVTGSLGMAMYPQDAGFGDTRRIAPELLHLADQRMFRRKAALQADLLQPA